jgi:homoserine acetyltransferase
LHAAGSPVEHVTIESDHGHDAFLLEIDQVGAALARFLSDVEKAYD